MDLKSLFDINGNSDRVFLVQPTDIGTITNSYSNLKKGTKPHTKGYRILIRTITTLAGILVAYGFAKIFHAKVNAFFFSMVGGGLAGFFTGKLSTPPAYYNVFAGTNGLAEYIIDAGKMEARLLQNLQFEKASFLVSKVQPVMINGRYDKTWFRFEWHNEEGDLIFQGRGSCVSMSSSPIIGTDTAYTGDTRFYFFRLAEQNWTRYLIEIATKKIAENKNYQCEFFILSKDGETREGSIILNPGSLDIILFEKIKVYRGDELKNILIGEGTFVMGEGMLSIADDENYWKEAEHEGNRINIPFYRITNSHFFFQTYNLWLK
jgi:hypothetical protein